MGSQASRRIVDRHGNFLTETQRFFTIAANGQQGAADAPTSGAVVVTALLMQVGNGATTVRFDSDNEDSPTLISPVSVFAANEKFQLVPNDDGWFQTLSGEGLTINTAGSTVTMSVTTAVLPDATARVPGSIVLAASAQNETSGAHTATITINRVTGFQGTVGCNYATADGTATAGVNYTAASGSVSFGDGVGSVTVPISILTGDAVLNKTFTVTISAPTGGANVSSPLVNTVTIAHL